MLEFKTILYEYQKEGFEKLKKYKVGALYMKMGTGKTRTMLEIVKDKYDRGKIDKVLWLCPCSNKKNIIEEFDKHIEIGKEIFLVFGIESMSSSIKLLSFINDYITKNRCLIVVDESIKIKNINALRTSNIIKIGEKCEYRYILNGSPISKNEADLFAQWYFLDWRILGYKSEHSFKKNHVIEAEGKNGKFLKIVNVKYLTKKIAPYTYQVDKEDVLNLPEKRYQNIFFDLDEEHYCQYIDVANYFIDKIDDKVPETIYKMFSHLLNMTSGYTYTILDDIISDKQFYYDDIENNKRIKCLLSILKEKYNNNKIIIFCEYRKEVDDIVGVLSKHYGSENIVRFDGKVSLKTRNKNIQSFKTNADILVANKDCAGYGLNLQFCDTVIYYNNDWDLATRVQSEDRIHRIGQNKEAKYISIIARNTIENKVIECLEKKIKMIDLFEEKIKENNKDFLKDILYKEMEVQNDKKI